MTRELVSEWTEQELAQQERCFCDCHTYPGVYPTTEQRPCSLCEHVNAFGYMPGISREGWVKYWRLSEVTK